MEWLLHFYNICANMGAEIFLSVLGVLLGVYMFSEVIDMRNNQKSNDCCIRQRKTAKYSEKAKENLIMNLHELSATCNKNPKNMRHCAKIVELYPDLINAPLAPNGYTPFLRVCMESCDELIFLMLNKGADVKICSADGETPFYICTYAIITNKTTSFNSLKMLLEKGCPINQATRNGYTPLHAAARHGHVALARWLLLNGADPNPPLCKIPPYMIAKKYGHEQMADLLFVNLGQGDETLEKIQSENNNEDNSIIFP